MPLLLLLVLLAVIGAIALVAAGRGGSLAAADPDRSPSGSLPDGPVDRATLDGLRFPVVFRGYRMDEVDRVLDRLVAELESRRSSDDAREGSMEDVREDRRDG